MRLPAYAAVAACALTLVPAQSDAQSAFGLGYRYSKVKADARSEDDSVRFDGGQIRARLSPRTGLEASLDLRTETNDAKTLRVRDMPLQVSLLLFPATGAFAPYLLAGPGWYSQRVQTLLGEDVVATETTRRFAWHGGFGAEVRFGRHLGIHADYRYTSLHYGSDDDDGDGDGDDSSSGRWFLPRYDGTMWTAGVTVYF
jgi:opacity protein-like surface antigen